MRALRFPLAALLVTAALFLFSDTTFAQSLTINPDEVAFKLNITGGNFSRAVNILLLMTMLSLAPAIVMTMTCFTRIVIVLSFLKQALSAQNIPSPKILASIALIMTIFIMQPVWTEMYEKAVEPLSKGEISDSVAFERAGAPLKHFMLRQCGDNSLLLFMDLAGMEPVDNLETLPFSVVLPAFIISELKTAFQMGFLIYLPFLLIDIVVSTVLMSMGMMMLPPMMISLPFKLLLFIIIDGWGLTIRSLVASFS
jgi:flagellar biosynthetic protein FliP